ncbi:hypothetical protein BH20ACT6_BH20ACT6_12000 [soil metagenome]
MSDPTAADGDDFHLARARSVAVLGRAATVAGVGVLALVASPPLLPAGAFRTGALVVAWTVTVVGVALTCLAAARVVRPPLLVRADADGMQVRVLRGAGLRSLAWADVRAVRRETLRVGPSVVVERNDGRCAVVPAALVHEGSSSLTRVLRARLDAAHGQRRL